MLLADEGSWELSLNGHIEVAHLLLMLGEAGEAAHEEAAWRRGEEESIAGCRAIVMHVVIAIAGSSRRVGSQWLMQSGSGPLSRRVRLGSCASHRDCRRCSRSRMLSGGCRPVWSARTRRVRASVYDGREMVLEPNDDSSSYLGPLGKNHALEPT